MRLPLTVLLSLVALLRSFEGVAAAAGLRVIATGDSLTCQYAGNLAAVFDRAGIGAVVPNPIVGGTGSANTARRG